MQNFNDWTFTAVNAIAGEVSNIQLRLSRVNGKTLEEIGVNPTMTDAELKYVMMAHLELTWNSYWLLDGAADTGAPPRAICPLNPGSVRVQLDKTTFPFRVSHYAFTIDDSALGCRG